ncbi:hypothetical protein Mapa_004423 [Marchantia paleacea]|nr:hypothetical protein Mapa_004423 [Marchantia paleacea]
MAIIFTWFRKFLSENPEVLRLVKVVQETLRQASVVGTTVWKARPDLEYEGFSIAKISNPSRLALDALQPGLLPGAHRNGPIQIRDTTVTATTSPTKFFVDVPTSTIDVAESNLEPDSYLPFGSGYRARRERRLPG